MHKFFDGRQDEVLSPVFFLRKLELQTLFPPEEEEDVSAPSNART